MTHLTIQATCIEADVLPEDQTWVSAFIDGESVLPAGGLNANPAISHQYYQYYQYQLIRQTLRGVSLATSTETITWHQTQLSRLWARVDAQTVVQDA